MSRANLYVDVGVFRDHFAGSSTLDTPDATGIERVLEAASRRVDEQARRHFYALTDTVVLAGNGCSTLKIPDLLAATSIKLDEDGDRTFELTLAAATDYYLVRHGHEDQDALPATMLRLDTINGQRTTLLERLRLIQIVGRWGFTEATEAVATTVNDNPLSAGALTLNVPAGKGALFSVGQTLLIESEQLYVSAIVTDALTVTRGVNGTTGAAHVQTTAISRFVYVPEVREAALILAGRMWKRRETAYANVIANPVVGSYETFKFMDPDVERLLAPLVRGDRIV